MRKTMFLLVVVGAFIVSSAMGAGAEWKSDKKFLKMFSGPEGGSWYPLGSGIMSLVETNIKGVSTSNGPGGGVGNCKAVQRGETDLGWTYSHTCYDGYNGRPPFTKGLGKIRYLASLYPGVFQVAVVRTDDDGGTWRNLPQEPTEERVKHLIEKVGWGN